MFGAIPDDREGAAVGATAPPVMGAPHDPQNVAPSATVAPHFAQLAIFPLLFYDWIFATLPWTPEGPASRSFYFLLTNPW